MPIDDMRRIGEVWLYGLDATAYCGERRWGTACGNDPSGNRLQQWNRFHKMLGIRAAEMEVEAEAATLEILPTPPKGPCPAAELEWET